MAQPKPDREAVRALLGGEIGNVMLGEPEVRSQRAEDGWLTQDLLFRSSLGDAVPAFLICPVDAETPVPAILYCHAHGGRYDIGRKELFDGRAALQSAYAADLRDLGCAVLCLEMPCFGERREPEESALSKSHLWHGRTLFGRMLAELVAGVDYLAEHPGIDETRIGAMGISMGGTHAWWLAAIEPRLRAAVNMCCLADLECLIATGAHDGHGPYMTVPGLVRLASTGELAALAAPRPQLVCVGLRDWCTPEECFDKARAALEAGYACSDAQNMIEFCVDPDAGHEETPAMRKAALAFFDKHLISRSCREPGIGNREGSAPR